MTCLHYNWDDYFERCGECGITRSAMKGGQYIDYDQPVYSKAELKRRMARRERLMTIMTPGMRSARKVRRDDTWLNVFVQAVVGLIILTGLYVVLSAV